MSSPRRWELRLIVDGVDLSHRVRSFELSWDFDAGGFSLSVSFVNPVDYVLKGEGLDPRDPISIYNQDGPLLGCYRPVSLDLRPAGTTGWRRYFEGFVGPAEISGTETWGEADFVNVDFVGISHPLKDWLIEERLALRYTKAAISAAGQPDLLNRIVMDQGFSIPIVYRDDPKYMVDEYIVSGVTLWQALEDALAPTGFRLVELWKPTGDGVEICVKDPLRLKTTPDRTLQGAFRRRTLKGNESDVRTFVAVVYRDRNDHQEKYLWAEASPEIVKKWGIPDGTGGRKHKKMVYKTSERSLVDSESEARELAAVILWDLQEPTPNIEIEIPWIDLDFLPFQLIEVIGETYATTLGLMNLRWSWEWENPYGRTVLQGAAKRVIGAKRLWLDRDCKRPKPFFLERKLVEILDEPPPRPEAPEVTGSWFVGPDGTPSPVADVVFKGPAPWWVTNRILRIYRFKLKETGVATGGTLEYLEDANKNWTGNEYSGAFRDWIFITSGPGAGQERPLGRVEGSRIYPREPFAVAPGPGSAYAILRLTRETSEMHLDLQPFFRVVGEPEGQFIGVSYAYTPRGR